MWPTVGSASEKREKEINISASSQVVVKLLFYNIDRRYVSTKIWTVTTEAMIFPFFAITLCSYYELCYDRRLVYDFLYLMAKLK